MTSPVQDLVEAEVLLRKYDNPAQANRVRECRETLEREGDAAYRHFAAGEWWGGAGSIADVNLHRLGQSQPTQEETDDNRRLRSALISIYAAMKVSGFTNAGAEKWTTVFRTWQKQGV